MENFRRYRKLDRIAITKILKSFSTNGCRKWKNKKFVVLAEYFEQQTDFSSYRIKIRQSRRSLLRRNQSYLQIFSLPRKWKPYHGAIRKFPRNLRTALERYFRFHLNYKRLRVEVRKSMPNCEIYFSIFSETIHTILKIFSQHSLRKCRLRLL